MGQTNHYLSSIVHNSEKNVPIQSIQTERQSFIEQIQSFKNTVLNDNAVPPETDLVSPEIIDSWIRSRDYGVDPDLSPGDCPTIRQEELNELLARNQSLIKATVVSIEQFEPLLHANYDIFLTDPNGVFILVTPGENNVLIKDVHLAPGMVWTEQTVGTTSITLAPLLKHPIQVCCSEIYLNYLRYTACSSAPIFDSQNNLLGVISIGTINSNFANSLMLSLVTSIAALIQQEYQSAAEKAEKGTLAFKREMYEYLFGSSSSSIEEILVLCKNQLTSNDLYSVCIVSTRTTESNEIWEDILCFSDNFLRQIDPEAFAIGGPQHVALIIPVRQKNFPGKSFLAELEKQVQVTALLGQSTLHPLSELRKCCDEARIAVCYLQLTEPNTNVQSFSDLGAFTPLFAHDLKPVKNFCQNTLKPLLDYDAQNESGLLTTLKELVNSNFNLRETAQKLFIHINTLYYRIDKIEQLLKVNLSLMSTRVDLYVAMQAWALLNASGLWD